jgi:hypothetical protein
MSETLIEARDRLRANVDEGETCPCCGQFAKVYRRKIHTTMARDLLTAYRTARYEWFHLPTLLGGRHQGDFPKLAHWQLIEEMPAQREDGSSRAGWWRLTPKGAAFARDLARVQKYARIYNGQLLGFDGDPVGIRDALGSRFSYNDLMAGV